jgi:hypothetical protein
MKHHALLFLFCLLLFCLMLTGSLAAQIVATSACDVLANPQSFDGKIVRIKGTVIAGFDEFLIRASGCNQSVGGIWLAYPDGTKGKAGPVAFVRLQLSHNNPASVATSSRPAVKLDKNKDFKQFDSLLATPPKVGGLCLGCVRYTVTATLVGRLDAVKDAGVVRDSAGRFVSVAGFGNLNRYPARLVLQSVSDVSSQEIDYSKIAALAKDEPAGDVGGGDPVAAVRRNAGAFPAGSTAASQLQEAAAAYGAEGEDNGVGIGFGIPNEVARNDTAKGDGNSPDGLLFNCTFDMDRLKGNALAAAISHVGTHIADIRGTHSPAPESDAYALEDHAWQTTVLSVVAGGTKVLTLPGGYLGWNSAWPAADRGHMVGEAVSKFLVDWAGLTKSAQ